MKKNLPEDEARTLHLQPYYLITHQVFNYPEFSWINYTYLRKEDHVRRTNDNVI
jgi:hypothetical protein